MVLMPETTMDKDNLAPKGEYEVRAPGKILVVEPVPVSASMQNLADEELGTRIA
jgi:hypothetical protein